MKRLRAVIRATESNYSSAYPVEGCVALKLWLRISQHLKLIYCLRIHAENTTAHMETNE